MFYLIYTKNIKTDMINTEYIKLLEKILDNGKIYDNNISLFGEILKYNMDYGFPIIPDNEINFEHVKIELLWVLNSPITMSYLIDNNFNMLNDYLYNRYINSYKFDSSGKWGKSTYNEDTNQNEPLPYTKSEFIKKTINDDEFKLKWLDTNEVIKEMGIYENDVDFTKNKDLFIKFINKIRVNPLDKEHYLRLYSIGEMDFQVKLIPINLEDRIKLLIKKNIDFNINTIDNDNEIFYTNNIQKFYISLIWYQKSIDMCNEFPFNISSYSLLLNIISKITNTIPHELISGFGNTYINKLDIDKIKFIIEKNIKPNLPIIDRLNNYYKINNNDTGDINIIRRNIEYKLNIVNDDDIIWDENVNPIITNLNITNFKLSYK